jgi:hypothetical protein
MLLPAGRIEKNKSKFLALELIRENRTTLPRHPLRQFFENEKK